MTIDTGLLSRELHETRLERVQNVNSRQSLFQRMLGVGSVDFDTAGSAEYDFTFHGVADPHAIVRTVDRALHETQHLHPGVVSCRSDGSAAPRRRPPASAPCSAVQALSRFVYASTAVPRPAAARRASALSVRSHVKSWSSRPKWP